MSFGLTQQGPSDVLSQDLTYWDLSETDGLTSRFRSLAKEAGNAAGQGPHVFWLRS